MLRFQWNDHYGEMCQGVDWDRCSLEELEIIVVGFGALRFSQLLEYMSNDGGGGKGMPDLLLWKCESWSGDQNDVVGNDENLELKENSNNNRNNNVVDLLIENSISKIQNENSKLTNENSIALSTNSNSNSNSTTTLKKPKGYPRNCSVKFSEVKGPSDRLSDHQRVWIDFFMRVGIAVDVCLVRTEVDKNNNNSKKHKSK